MWTIHRLRHMDGARRQLIFGEPGGPTEARSAARYVRCAPGVPQAGREARRAAPAACRTRDTVCLRAAVPHAAALVPQARQGRSRGRGDVFVHVSGVNEGPRAQAGCHPGTCG